MEFMDFFKQYEVGLAVGGAVLALVTCSKIDNMYDLVVEGRVLQKATISQDIPEKSQQTNPYWVDVQTEQYGVLRLNFDTSDITYDNRSHSEKSGIFVQMGRIGDFKGKALSLEERFQVGDRVKIKVDERSGQEMMAKSIEEIRR